MKFTTAHFASAAFLWLLLLASCGQAPPQTADAAPSPEQEAEFQNVIFIIGDDHAMPVLGTYGNNLIRTPNLDKLATEGVKFTRAYANAPICSASRQSLLTAKYPHASGVNLLFTPFPDHGNVTVAEFLKDKGFSTALVGKSHFNHFVWGPLYQEGAPNHGFDTIIDKGHYRQWLKENPPRPVPEDIMTRERAEKYEGAAWIKNADRLPVGVYEEDSEATFLARRAAEFIEQNKEGRFCLWLAFHQPHAPFYFPADYAGKYPPEMVPLPQGSPEDDRWVPELFRDLTEAQRRGIVSSYYTSVEYMDNNIGRVMQALEAAGLRENTLVVYAGDQGYLLNDHKRFEKHTFWKESIQAPLIISGGSKLAQRQSSGELVGFVDVVPTVTELLGFAPHPDFQGKSFAQLLKDPSMQREKEYVFGEYLHDNMAMVASKDFKYIFHTGKRDLDLGYTTGHGPSGMYHWLFNLQKDQGETTNLASRQPLKVRELQRVMLNFFMRTHPEADKCPEELTLEGKLVWFCEPRDVGGEHTDHPFRVYPNEAFEEI